MEKDSATRKSVRDFFRLKPRKNLSIDLPDDDLRQHPR